MRNQIKGIETMKPITKEQYKTMTDYYKDKLNKGGVIGQSKNSKANLDEAKKLAAIHLITRY